MYKVIRRVTARGLSTFNSSGSKSSSEVRKMFLDYFENEHNHVFIPSSPVVPSYDPTTPFVNAGMYQFKDVFLGLVTPESTRVVNSQKCIRLKGQGGSLDDIGKDGTHHTFFEMLGNWSFGDYYKKEACLMSWKFLTEVCNISPDRLYVTYFNGDEELGLGPDTETPEIWAEIGVPRNRILPFGKSENFWRMSSTGPCGPSTEIHYDHVPGNSDASHLVNGNSPLVKELWNVVFMEYKRTKDGLERLDRHFVDTGMGLERLVSILQDRVSNYETDIFWPLYGVIQRISRHSGYTGSYDGNEMDVAYRALADHARMITVALSDGATPDMSKRLRMVLRRAFQISRNMFNVESGLVGELSQRVAENLSPAYPEVAHKADLVQFVIEEEEKKFASREEMLTQAKNEFLKSHPEFGKIDVRNSWNLVDGHKYLKKKIAESGSNKVDGLVSWTLFETYGIPKKGIRKICEIMGLDFKAEEFDEFWKKSVSDQTRDHQSQFERIRVKPRLVTANLPELKTRIITDCVNYENVGINSLGECIVKEVPAKVTGIVVNGAYVDNIDSVDRETVTQLGVIFNETNFIPKTEFVQGDVGMFQVGNSVLKIYMSKKMGNNIIHYCDINSFKELESFAVGEEGTLLVDSGSRTDMIANSTANLLLQGLLHKRFKTFCLNRSFIEIQRFKISYTTYGEENLTTKELMTLENDLNDLIRNGGRTEKKLCSVSEVRGMDDLIVRCGQTFINSNIPICKLSTPNFSLRFHCPFPVFPELSMIGDLVVTRYLPKQRKSLTHLGAVTRESASKVLANKERALNIWSSLRNFHLVEFDDIKTVDENLKNVENFFSVLEKETYPIYIKKTIMEEIAQKIKHVREIVKDEVKFDRSIQPTKRNS